MPAEIEPLGPEWKRNPGYQPKSTKGKRVRVVLNHGREPRYNEAPLPPGWAADKADWSKSDFDFHIAFWRLL